MRFTVVAGAALALCGNSIGAQAPSALAAHLDSARMLSGSDISPAIMKVLCAEPKDIGAFLAPIAANSKPMAPTRAFDQLYYLGMDFVGSWALKTSDGIILFDALDNTAEAQSIIEGGMHTLGLDPVQIKYIVIMHGHGDHYGGAKYLQEKYHPKVFMSAADWDFAPVWLAGYAKVVGAAAAAKFGDIPTRDQIITDGEKLTLGNTTVTLYLTPGHTPGSVSAIIPVRDHGKDHVISFWGGTALPPDLAGKQQYQKSVERFLGIIDQAKVDAVISNHPFIDGTSDKVLKIQSRGPNDPNPFVIGHDAVMRYMGVHRQCVEAAEAR
jgi:metallo-beta-lactamase class B